MTEDELAEKGSIILHEMLEFFTEYGKLVPRGSPLDLTASMILAMARRFDPKWRAREKSTVS